MGRRRKEASTMGKSLIKDRFRGKQIVRGGDSFLHTTDMNDGSEYTGQTLQSVTEQTDLDDFLNTAELAGRDFTAERENVKIVTNYSEVHLNSTENMQKIRAAQDLHQSLLCIPRRPAWTETTTPDKLKEDEHMSFLEWRRQLGKLQEEEHIVITPYEKNLEFWRQLWRVIERSDVVVQIVDARNPLLFWSPDLDKYVKEVNPRKRTCLLINKADYLTDNQRKAWSDFFTTKGVSVVFWSAKDEADRLAELDREAEEEAANAANKDTNDDTTDDDDDDDDDDKNQGGNLFVNTSKLGDSGDNNKDVVTKATSAGDTQDNDDEEDGDDDENSDGFETEEEVTADEDDDDDDGDKDDEDDEDDDDDDDEDDAATEARVPAPTGQQTTSSRMETSEQLLQMFRATAVGQVTAGVTTVGMVGYPNVGKSSTINAILRTKKVPVSATPGRTKHFQTLFVEKDLMLCDCPGLVFPSFVNSKAELVVNGILPIDQLMDCEPSVSLVCERIGQAGLEGTYNFNLPPPEKWEESDRPPSAYNLLHTYGLLRGFMTHKGNTDRPRAARYILKDYVNGKLLFCQSPPGIEAAAFQLPPYAGPKVYKAVTSQNVQKTLSEMKTEVLDREFFAQSKVKAHAVGPHAVGNYVRTEALRQVSRGEGQGDGSEDAASLSGSMASLNVAGVAGGKPWKKHNNRNKKEKLRRVYAQHDQHC